jgi:hypothetical protein
MPQWLRDDLDKLLDESRVERITRAIEIGIAIWIVVGVAILVLVAVHGG